MHIENSDTGRTFVQDRHVYLFGSITFLRNSSLPSNKYTKYMMCLWIIYSEGNVSMNFTKVFVYYTDWYTVFKINHSNCINEPLII